MLAALMIMVLTTGLTALTLWLWLRLERSVGRLAVVAGAAVVSAIIRRGL